MKWFEVAVFIMTMFCVVCAEDEGDEEGLQDNTREMREMEREGWRAVETFQEGNFGWIPHDSPEEQIPKRRRLRKRKRRPPVPLTGDFNLEEASVDHAPSSRRRIRPQRLEQFREPWEEMTEEIVRRPNVRRRVTPSYQSPKEVVFSEEVRSNPLAATIHFEDAPGNKEAKEERVEEVNKGEEAVEETIPTDLKTVLKQTGGGLSLSEVLQQKNLSLAELLMGNKKAISALTERTRDATEFPTDIHTRTAVDTKVSEPTKYKRLPPSVGMKKNMNRNYDQDDKSLENISTKEMLETQRKRLALLHGNKESKLFSSVTKYDVVTEPTTERRIFVPSHPKYYTSLVFKPDFNPYNEQSTEPLLQSSNKEEPPTTTTTTTTTTTPKTIPTTNNLPLKLRGLPITNAKITKTTTKATVTWKEKEEENYHMNFQFPEPIKINVNEVFGFKDRKKKVGNTERPQMQSKSKDEPMRISIDLEEFMETTTKITEFENYPQRKITQAIPTTVTDEPLGEKINNVTAKEELMEVFKDPVSRERLSRILENRNMTIEELVEQRERGSSQLHLADIFHNKTREPEPKEEPFVGHVSSEYFNSFPSFGRQQKSRNFEDESSEHTSKVSQAQTVTESTPYLVSSFPTVQVEVNQNGKQPFYWKELYPDLFSNAPEVNSKKNSEDLSDPFKTVEDYSEEDIQRLEDIDNTLSLASNEKLNVDESSIEQEDIIANIPSGVKSAIMVSLVIIGMSIIVFLTILLVFRWTQRQKRKLNYCNSLSSKIKSPIIMQKHPANAIKSFVNETLGRKKNYYKSNIHSLSDDMWESGRDRKQSF